ncbi:hypothetical protein [Brevibacillus marinus]|nr:hypothetical protein [Brevibacillus marinus]
MAFIKTFDQNPADRSLERYREKAQQQRISRQEIGESGDSSLLFY